MFCINCGKEVSGGANYCGACDARTRHDETPPTLPNSVVHQVQQIVASVSQRPWVRFWARNIDTLVFSFFCGIVIGFTNFPAFNEQLLSLIILPIYVLFEPWLLSTFGNTPGRWLLRITLVSPSGGTLTYSEGVSRSLKVWVRGLGLGIPLIALFTMISAYKSLMQHGTTSWDKEGNFIVLHEKIGLVRVVAAVLFFILWLALLVAAS